MKTSIRRVAVAVTVLAGVSSLRAESRSDDLQQQVAAAERAFAQTMADRDHEAFSGFVSKEAVFLGRSTFQGRTEVAEGWKGFFEGEDAPFSWEPETVEVLASGTLALSTGPVSDAQGRRVSTFTSIWRLEEDGVWRVVFDRGNKYCE